MIRRAAGQHRRAARVNALCDFPAGQRQVGGRSQPATLCAGMTKVADEPERQLMVRENGIAAIRPLNTYGRVRPESVVQVHHSERQVSPEAAIPHSGSRSGPANDWEWVGNPMGGN